MQQTNEPGAAAAAVESASWFLHSAGKQFGPLSSDELRRYFTSGMITAADVVSRAGIDGELSAAEAAKLLEVAPPPEAPPSVVRALPPMAAPVVPAVPAVAVTAGPDTSAPGVPTGSAPAAAPAVAPAGMPAEPAVRDFKITHVGPWLGWRGLALWLTALFAVQFFLIPKNILGAEHSMREFVATAFARYLGIAALCFLVPALLAKLVAGKYPSTKAPLIAMTLVYALLLGNHVLHPDGANAPIVTTPTESMPLASTPAQQNPQADSAPPGADGNLPPMPVSDVGMPPAETAQTQAGSIAPVAPATSPVNDVEPGSASIRDDMFNEARELAIKEDWEALLSLSLRWTRDHPERATAWMFLGIAYHNMMKYEESLAAYKRALSIAPNDYWILYNLGVLYSAYPDYQKALETYHQALALWPQSSDAWLNLGNAHAGLYQHENAIAAWETALQFNPNQILAWNNLGWEYYRLNQFGKAIDAYQKALAIDPNNADAKNGLNNARQR